MNGAGVIFLGMRYVLRNRVKVSLLIAAFTLVWLLPMGIGLLVKRAEVQLRARAVDTPMLLGYSGSSLELTFNALYFTKPDIATLPFRELARLQDSGLVDAIPIYSRFSAAGHRIVGTSYEYFDFRGLEYADGRALLRLGECVIGADVATEQGIGVGDFLISSPETLFDLAGVYPLKMEVCGILAPAGTPDDGAIFVAPKTAWIIEGLGHGHVDAKEASGDQKLESVEGSTTLNASVDQYNVITPENAASFHFHGEEGDNPLSAIIAIPHNVKSQALIKGRYASSDTLQLIEPESEMDDLFDTVFSVQRLVIWLLLAVGAAALLIGALVFLLSHRLRIDEFSHLRRLGADPGVIRALIAFEAVFVLIASLLACGLGLWVVDQLAPFLMRTVLS